MRESLLADNYDNQYLNDVVIVVLHNISDAMSLCVGQRKGNKSGKDVSHGPPLSSAFNHS